MKVETLVQIRGDHKRCILCGSVETLTIDHLIPLSRGGKNDITNYIILCGPCNSMKSDQTIDELLKRVEKMTNILRLWKTNL